MKFNLLIGLLVLLLVGTLSYNFHVDHRVSDQHIAGLHLLHEIRGEVTYSHLLLEELVNGDPEVSQDEVEGHFATALSHGRTLAAGAGGDELGREVPPLVASLHSFGAIMAQRLNSPHPLAVSGSRLDQDHDAVFSHLIKETKAVEDGLWQRMATDIAAMRLYQALTTVFCLLLSLAIGLVFRTAQRHRRIQLEQSNDQLRTVVDELTAISTFGKRINAELDVSKIARMALEEIAKAATSDFAVIYRRDEGRLRLLAEHNRGRQPTGIMPEFKELGQCLCGLAGQGEAIYSSNILTDRRCTLTECKEAGFRSFVALPLAKGDTVLGVLGLATTAERDFAKQATFLETMAERLASALQNSLLYEHRILQHAAIQEQLELLLVNTEINTALTRNDTLRGMLDQCCRLLTDYLDAVFTRVWTMNPEGDCLELQASAGLYTNIDGRHSRKPLAQAGKITRIAVSKEPHLTNQVAGDPLVVDQDWVRQEGIQAFAGYPLMVDGRVIGVIGLFSRHALSMVTTRTLAAIADGIALGIGHKRAEEELIRSNRAFKILSRCNEALIHATTESELLDKICAIIAGSEGYRMAWVGYAEDDAAKSVIPMATAGFDEGYLNLTISWADGDSGHGPTGTAIRTGTTSLMKDILNDPRFAPWRQAARDRGYTSSIALPLLDSNGKPFGALNIYSAESNAFPADEIKLLEELGHDLAFGIMTLRMREAQKRSEVEKEGLKKQLIQSQKMEMIGTLAGGISHDFNNLLHIIQGYTTLLLDDTAKESQQYEFLTRIKDAGERAAELITQILTFSKGGEQERRPLQLRPLVKEVLKLLGRTLPTTIEIRQNIAPQVDMVLADATQMHQVLMNLCTNAYHAMRETGGQLTVKLDETDVGEEAARQIPGGLAPGRYVRLIVQDTGCGMTAVILERIFEPYFTTKEKGEGTGLGLATVHGIVYSHGGGIRVESEPGTGTTFSLYFPALAEGGEAAAEKADAAAPLPVLHGHVLFVDDMGFNVTLGKQFFERLGCTVMGCTDSLQALEAFTAEPSRFDLVVTDQTMPSLTGFDLAKKLLRIRPELPIFMVTGHSDTVDEEKAKAIGIREFLMKPLNPKALAIAARKALGPAGP